MDPFEFIKDVGPESVRKLFEDNYLDEVLPAKNTITLSFCFARVADGKHSSKYKKFLIDLGDAKQFEYKEDTYTLTTADQVKHELYALKSHGPRDYVVAKYKKVQ